MKKIKNIKKLEKEYEQIKTCGAGDTRFTAQALMFLCYRIDSYISFEKRLEMLLFDIETRFGSEMDPRELFEKHFPEMRY